MSDFVEAIVKDLRSFSGELTQSGGRPSRRATMGGGGSLSGLLFVIDSMLSLLPTLLEELEVVESRERVEVQPSRSPVGATLSKRPTDYTHHEGRFVPRTWAKAIPLREPMEDALRWLVFILEKQKDHLERASQIQRRRVEEALSISDGDSVWAEKERRALLARGEVLERRRIALLRARSAVRRLTRTRIVASRRPPRPFPTSLAWQSLKRRAHEFLQPESSPQRYVDHLLGGTVDMADLGYLYQRWCGVKILGILQERGWRIRGDQIGALFLGGRLELLREDTQIEFYVEPRIGSRERHASGLMSLTQSDVTPDFVFITPGPTGVDAFVLDPSIHCMDDALREKGRYLRLLARDEVAVIAGVPCGRPAPLRSWAAAPLHRPRCAPFEQDGRVGVVPMHPVEWSTSPIEGWLADIEKHAHAWTGMIAG